MACPLAVVVDAAPVASAASHRSISHARRGRGGCLRRTPPVSKTCNYDVARRLPRFFTSGIGEGRPASLRETRAVIVHAATADDGVGRGESSSSGTDDGDGDRGESRGDQEESSALQLQEATGGPPSAPSVRTGRPSCLYISPICETKASFNSQGIRRVVVVRVTRCGRGWRW